MKKIQSLSLGGFAFLGVLSVWQFMKIQDLQQANTELIQKHVARPVAAPTLPRVSSGLAQAGKTPGAAAQAVPAPAAPVEDPERAAREARFREFRQIDREQRHEARVLALTTKLNLTPDQQAAVREALKQGSSERDAVREAGDVRRTAGTPETDETRRADMAKIAAIELKQEEKIAATMSSDQQASYGEYKTEQKQVAVENRANQMLGDLQNRFSLTEEQKEAAFQYFAKQEQESGFDPAQVIAQGGDPMALMEQMQKERLQALEQILTPEQFSLHSAQEAQRTEMFRNFRPGGATGQP